MEKSSALEINIKEEHIDHYSIKEEHFSFSESPTIMDEPPPLTPIHPSYSNVILIQEPGLPLLVPLTKTQPVQLKLHCTFCSDVFSSPETLRNHRLNFHKHVKALHCIVCKRKYKCKLTLVKHLQKHVASIKIDGKIQKFCNCCACGKNNSKSKDKVQIHKSQLQEKNYSFECDKCNKYVDNASYLEHLLSKCAVKYSLQCKVCYQLFFSVHELKEHTFHSH